MREGHKWLLLPHLTGLETRATFQSFFKLTLLVTRCPTRDHRPVRGENQFADAVIDHINKTLNKLNNIATIITQVTHIIEGTTNMLASAFSAGIIKSKSNMVKN